MAAKHARSGDMPQSSAHSKSFSNDVRHDAARRSSRGRSASLDRSPLPSQVRTPLSAEAKERKRSVASDALKSADSCQNRGSSGAHGRHASDPTLLQREQLARYSRDNSSNYRSRRKKMALWKKALIAVGSLILLAVCATGAYALWFSGQLNERLSMGDQQDAAVDDVLSSPIAGEPFYMLLLGSDSREGSGTSGNAAESGDNQRSDVMILVRVDAKNKQVTMVSIPRDTPLTLEDGSIVKLNEAYNIGGAAYSIKAVSDLTGVPITHYAEVHFSEFQDLVDKLGGVEVDVPIELSYKDALTGEWVTLQPGVQTLDGQQAQIFARARHEYETDQDAHRQNNIRTLLEAIITKVLEKPFYELPDTVLNLAESVGTDLNAADLVTLAMEYAGGSGSMTMYSCTGPTDGDINESAGGIWLCYENPEGWANLMSVVDAGEDPSGLDVNSTAIIPAAA